MNLRRTALLLCSFVTILTARAQLRTAIAGGYHIASVPGNANPGWDSLNYDHASRKGIHIGLMADVPFSPNSNFYFQPGMFFSNKGQRFSTSLDTATGDISNVTARQFINYMEIPLNLVYKVGLGKKSSLLIGGGPYVSFLYGGKERKDVYYKNGDVTTTENTDLKRARTFGQYNNLDYGANALLGFELGRVYLTANYSQGLGDFYKADNNDGSFRHQVMGATVGFFLGKKKERNRERDRDKDGIPDHLDGCPKTKGTVATNGCPDKDGDGVPDKEDKCPDQKGDIKSKGCPATDSDKDGVNDDEDKCPDVAGSLENGGCPDVDHALQDEVGIRAGKIQFEYASSAITAQSKIALDGIVNILIDNPQLKLTIEGYTSSDGRASNHSRLSQARADNVRKYLESKGIEAKRLSAAGRGTSNPLNGNKTELERKLNRRVELKLTY